MQKSIFQNKQNYIKTDSIIFEILNISKLYVFLHFIINSYYINLFISFIVFEFYVRKYTHTITQHMCAKEIAYIKHISNAQQNKEKHRNMRTRKY